MRIQQEMNVLQGQLRSLREKEKDLLSKIDQKRANKTFPCLCGKRHAFKKCDVIQTHWYTSPSGCTEGDYWNMGELQIICPVTDHKNRLLFSSYYNVPYENRRDYNWNIGMQFSRLYKHLFKSVIDDYDKDNRPWVNCYHIDENYKKYDLHLGPKEK